MRNAPGRRPAAAVLLVPLFAVIGALQDPPPATKPAEDAERLRERGERLLSEGNPAGASEAFRAARKADGGTLPSRLGLVRALLADRRLNDALDELDEAGSLAPSDPDVLLLFGRAFLAKGESMAAEAAGATRALAFEEAARRGWFEDASTKLRALLAKKPRHPEAETLLARARFALGDLEGAEGAARQAAEGDPKLPGLAGLRGDIAFARYRQGKEEKAPAEALGRLVADARALYEEAVRSDPADPRPAKSLGDLYLWEARTPEAAQAYGEALARDPSSVDLSFLTSRLEPALARETIRKATAKFETSHPREPKGSAPLHWYLGYLHYHAGEFAPSRESFAKAVAKNPSFTNAHYYLAKLAYQEKDYAAAETSFLAVARAGFDAFAEMIRGSGTAQTDQDILSFLADRAAREYRDAEARDLFRALATLDPENADFWNNYAFFARDSGQAEASYAAYRRALELRPDDPQMLNAAGVVLHYNLERDLDEARKLYERAIACAERILANRDASAKAKEEARTAKLDAETNLRRLKEGRTDRRRPG